MADTSDPFKEVEIRFERVEVLLLQFMEERAARLRLQLQLLQHQGQRIQEELAKADKEKAALLSSLEDKYGMDVSKFSVDTDTCIATGLAPLSSSEE